MYTLRLYDDNLNLLKALHNAASFSYSRRPNNAGSGSFSYPHDSADAELFELVSSIAIYRDDVQLFAGRITSRDLSGNEYHLDAEGHEARLRFRTPRQWVRWEGEDLADVVRDALKRFRFARYTTQTDWQAAQELYQVDLATEPGTVFVEYEPHPDDPENERPKESGYLIIRKDLGADALTTGRIVRWTETVGDNERITIQSRTADTEADLTSQSWSAEQSALHVGDIAQNETEGIDIVDGGRWIEVKVNLYANDRETVHRENGEIVGYGYTPMLHGLEIIWREASEIAEGNIPVTCGQEVSGFTVDRQTHLRVLADMCEEYGWEFRIRHDEEAGQLVLDLGQEIGAEWQKTIGDDRTTSSSDPIVLRHGDNARITTLRDNTDKLCTVLHCWGAGQGADQLYVRLEDSDAIEEYGEIEDDFTLTEAETIAELTTAGQEELDARSQPEVSFEIEVYDDEVLSALQLGTSVTVAHPRSGNLIDCRILEESRRYDAYGETMTVGLDNFLYNPAEALLGREDSLHSPAPTVAPPSQLAAEGKYGYVVVNWRGDGDAYGIRYREVGETEWQYADTREARFVHQQLAIDSTWEYQVAIIKGGRISDWAGPTEATVLRVPPEDVDDQAPAAPVWAETDPLTTDEIVTAANQRLVRIRLSWQANTEDDLEEYLVYRSEDGGMSWEHVSTIAAGTETWTDTDGLETSHEYRYFLVAVDTFGNQSTPSATEVITTQDNPSPAIPLDAPDVIAGFKRMAVVLPGVTSDNDKRSLAYYRVQYETCDADYNEGTGTYSMPASPVWSEPVDLDGGDINGRIATHDGLDYSKGYRYRYQAVNTSGNTSNWSNWSAGDVAYKTGHEDMAFNSIHAEQYHEIRNTIQAQVLDQLDATHPLTLDFYILDEYTGGLLEFKPIVYGQPFRAYSTTAASAGQHSHALDVMWLSEPTQRAETGITLESAGSHNHAGSTGSTTTGISIADHDAHSHTHTLYVADYLGDTGSASETFASIFSNQQHSHIVDVTTGSTTEETSLEWPGVYANYTDHTHDITHGHLLDGSINPANISSHLITDPGHTHSISGAGSHTHAVVEPSTEPPNVIYGHYHNHLVIEVDNSTAISGGTHAHDIVYGIYEEDNNVTLYVKARNSISDSWITLQTITGLCSSIAWEGAWNDTLLSGSGRKQVKIESTGRARVNCIVLAKYDITA